MRHNLLSAFGRCRERFRSGQRFAFTLVELLVVLFLLLILAAVALPTIRNVLVDQKNSRAARSIASFVDVARSRAIAEEREVGVYLERLSEAVDGAGNASDPIGAGASIRLRQMTGVPPYSGESGDSVAELAHFNGVTKDPPDDASSNYNSGTTTNWATIPGVNQAIFESIDNPILDLSATIYRGPRAARDNAPIRPLVDRLELPGGKVVPILNMEKIVFNGRDCVALRFDLRDVSSGAATFPMASRVVLNPGQRVKYRIHRSAVMSSTSPLALPRGVAIDLNLSGIGISGADFAAATAAVRPIVINFGPDGRVSRVIRADGSYVIPYGQIFLCLGDLAGIRPDNLFADQGRDRSNLTRPKSSWITINNQTGRVSVAPFAPVQSSTLVAGNLPAALSESRLLAILSDSVEGN
jgi:prepilin-type N-terminal cleavage/methylation domain-containing protein